MSTTLSNLNELAQLADRVAMALAGNPYLRARSVDFETEDGHVKLHGKVHTYFQKQMAQELLRGVRGVKSIENQIDVQWAK
ncbi:MAG: BON domain-containing protein [Planctomycetota bacterium]|nr:MAG: BON domain-containing protein [Planctomycetota bacterium]REJ92372.1 MAG: BON domain-containing protein [Planctomycetota bacterium]REK30236.1 MAG: BON domain-containing protein [Planctomycetota bacterium]REK46122.1 MAG: BON domain-containing protein [Planctomycetota bacterium]